VTTNINHKIHIIAGPTASGKSARALEIAQKTGGVIINADSQQLFKDLPILTARPTPAEEQLAPHKLYGILNANEQPSVGKWLKFAKMEIDWALDSGTPPIVVGGTGMYIKALMQGIAEIPDIEESVRQQAENDYDSMGKEAFSERLKIVDPQFFERLKVVDKQRLVRAYSVWLGSGKPLSFWQAQELKPFYPADSFGIEIIEIDRKELYRRCDARFVKMVEMGAVEEVERIEELKKWRNEEKKDYPIPQFLNSSIPLLKVIGVAELSAYICAEISLDEATRKAQQATRNYAKRQVTWFRHQLY
jgi:tRNA dimethylallyltransferase